MPVAVDDHEPSILSGKVEELENSEMPVLPLATPWSAGDMRVANAPDGGKPFAG